MSPTLFANDCLVDILVRYIGIVDERVAVLSSHADPASGAASPLLPEALLEGACADLKGAIPRLGEPGAMQGRGLPADAMDEFAYLMAAWADEALISTFRERLPRRFNGAVEHLLFGTMDAGEQVFARIDRLLARRAYGDTALAAAYLLVLELGFRGQYTTPEAAPTLARYARELSVLALAPSLPDAEKDGPARAVAPPARPVAPAPWQRADVLWALAAALWLAAGIGMGIAWDGATRTARRTVAELEAAPKLPPRRSASGDSHE